MNMRLTVIIPMLLATVLSGAGQARAHSPTYTFRAYLDKRFWQPFSKYEQSLDAVVAGTLGDGRNSGAPRGKKHVFAGMSAEPAGDMLRQARVAYAAGDFTVAQEPLDNGQVARLNEQEREELLLVHAKMLLRSTEKKDAERLKEARSRLTEFLKTCRTPGWRSEANGWLARAHYLLGEHSAAAKIYLDELGNPRTVYSRDSLIASLRILFPYNGSAARLADHLEEYFDTPAHALFVVNIVTNPIYFSREERAAMAKVAQAAIDTLLKHRELFATGPWSDQLALALMRASLYRGDVASARTYAGWITSGSSVTATVEYNWMLAACAFLKRNYGAAEEPLTRIMNSREATFREKNAATQGLIGVYQKTGRAADQLHAAFVYESLPSYGLYGRDGEFGESPYIGFVYWPMAGWLFDLPYLLDVQLSDEQLRQYLKRYARRDAGIRVSLRYRPRSAVEVARYALAVRYARQERYEEAAAIYESLNARPRARRMRALARLRAKAVNSSPASREQLEARFAYASYLEANSTRIFFNDMLWSGYQTWAFIQPDTDQGLTREERELFLRRERNLRDEQEERWRAYHILVGVMEKAGRGELGRRCARKALRCLNLINTGRFGREEEIAAARRKLLAWPREK